MGAATMQPHHHRVHGAGNGGGAALSVPALAFAAVLVTSIIMWLSDATANATQKVDCNAFSSFLDRRHVHAHVTQMLSEAPALPAVQAAMAQAAAPPGLDPATASALGGVAGDAMHRVGWRSGVKYARFDAAATIDGVLASSMSHAGSFLLVVPGNGSLERRAMGMPFFSIDPTAASLAAVLAPAAAALNAAVGLLEASLGRRLFSFQLETALLPACTAGSGPCAMWEPSSGRLVLDASLAGRIAAVAGAGAAADSGAPAAPGGPEAAGAAPGKAEPASAVGVAAAVSAVASPAAAASLPASGSSPSGRGSSSDSSSSDSDDGDLSDLLVAFVGKLVEEAAEAGSLLKKGTATLPVLAAIFAKAGATSVTLLMASHVSLWWCIACPLVLGMLAPFIFNFGLTAAAEALCAQLQLPDDTCSDLWWGAFAVALILSLASSVPIVYLCRLPECGRRGAVAALAVAARMVSS